MLSSKKLRTGLALCLSLLWWDSYASPHRFYLILQTEELQSQSYIGSVTVDDDTQALAAQIFFPEGVVNIEMEILNGLTVDLQVNSNQNNIQVAPSSQPETSPLSRALQAGAGNPWMWFTTPLLMSYQFKLPDFSELSLIQLSKATNAVGNISIQRDQTQSPAISNLSYVAGGLSLSPGFETFGLQRGVVDQVADGYLLQLFELMITALISPQLVAGQHFQTNKKSNISDPTHRLPLKIVPTGPPQQGMAKVIQRYILSVWQGHFWARHEVDENGLQGITSTSHGMYISTPQGRKFCVVVPVLRQTISGGSALSGGTLWGPPYHCREDSDDRNGKGGGFNGGSGSGSGGRGSSVY